MNIHAGIYGTEKLAIRRMPRSRSAFDPAVLAIVALQTKTGSELLIGSRVCGLGCTDPLNIIRVDALYPLARFIAGGMAGELQPRVVEPHILAGGIAHPQHH